MVKDRKPRAETIALDGPAASGKNTVGRLLAQRLGYIFIDTGAMYRALTWLAREQGVALTDRNGLGRLAHQVRITLASGTEADGPAQVFIDGNEVTGNLTLPEVEAAVSQVAMVEEVRSALVAQQRTLAKEGKIVMAGRDIGTVVLPDAIIKVFLTASAEERARRRYQELRQQGLAPGYQQVLSELQRRDMLDSERKVSPLHPAPDAHLITTDGRSPEEVVEEIVRIIEEG